MNKYKTLGDFREATKDLSDDLDLEVYYRDQDGISEGGTVTFLKVYTGYVLLGADYREGIV